MALIARFVSILLRTTVTISLFQASGADRRCPNALYDFMATLRFFQGNLESRVKKANSLLMDYFKWTISNGLFQMDFKPAIAVARMGK
jgi:hypothetical protein